MTRISKGLALALISVSLIGAVATASMASAAQEFHSKEEGFTVLTGSEDGAAPAVFAFGTTEIKCTKAKFEGTTLGTAVEEITMHRTYESCETFEAGDTTFTPNDCAFVLEAKTDANGHGKMHIECEEEDEIEIRIETGIGPCTLYLKEQTPNGGVHFSNKEEGGIRHYTMKVTAEGLQYGTAGKLCNSFAGTGKDMTYSGQVTIKGYEFEKLEGRQTTPTYTVGKQVSVWWE